MSIRMVFNPQFGGKEKTYADVETIMRKHSLTHVSDDARKIIEKAERTGDLLYGVVNPFSAEMSAGEENPTHELIVGTDKDAIVTIFYNLQASI